MQNIANKIVKGFQDLKLKFVRKQNIPQFILYEDFLRFETSAKLLSFSFLKGEITPPNKWLKLNKLILQAAVVAFLLLEIISLVMSMHQKAFHVTIENIMLLGGYVIMLGKIFIIFLYKRDKIDEVIETLDKHYPHYGVD